MVRVFQHGAQSVGDGEMPSLLGAIAKVEQRFLWRAVKVYGKSRGLHGFGMAYNPFAPVRKRQSFVLPLTAVLKGNVAMNAWLTVGFFSPQGGLNSA